jgi:hypothetical protein
MVDRRMGPEQLLVSPKLQEIRTLATQALLVLDRSADTE